MILQVANIVSGIVLALPGLKSRVKDPTHQESLEKLETQTKSWAATLGLVELVLGLVGLLDRINIFPFYISELGSSFPQAIPAILAGLVLALPKLAKYPSLQTHIVKLEPHAFWIGLLAIAVGLGSLLFGCIAPICTPLSF